MKFCECGCGKEVKKEGNKFLLGHNSRCLSIKSKKKMSEAHHGKQHSKETKKKIGDGNRGKIVSKESRELISLNHADVSGKNHPFFGKHHSEETKKKIGSLNSGENCHFWKGGVSFEPYSPDWKKSLKESIRQRDKHTCCICGIKWQLGVKSFPVHHIDYNKKNCCPNNLITLCRACHSKTNDNREQWKEVLLCLLIWSNNE